MDYQPRFYRSYHKSNSLKSYQITIEQSDLYIASTNLTDKLAVTALQDAREIIQSYIIKNPNFLSSLKPVNLSSDIPLISWMLNASKVCSVGPMAAVAGSVSRFVGEALLKENDEVIVENGGDIFMSSNVARNILVYAGNSPVSMKMAIEIPEGTYGMCTSAGKVGPSLSFGQADAAIVLSKDCSLSDAAATQLGNFIKNESDIESAVNRIISLPNILGAMAISNDKIAAAGQITLTSV